MAETVENTIFSMVVAIFYCVELVLLLIILIS